MAIRCPQCAIPITKDEASARRCPVCGTALLDVEVSIAAGPAPSRALDSLETLPQLDVRWKSVRGGVEQMFQGVILMLLAVGLHLMIGDAANRSERQSGAGSLAALLFLLMVAACVIYYAVGAIRCSLAPRPSGPWMIGYLISLAVGIIVPLLIFLAALRGLEGRQAGLLIWLLIGMGAAAGIAALVSLTYFAISVGQVFGNQRLARLCTFMLRVQILWAILELNNQAFFKPDSHRHVSLISELVSWLGLAGSALWHAIMLYQVQKTIGLGIAPEREPSTRGKQRT